MSDSPADSDLPGLRVLAHPLRLRLLSLLTGTAMSAAEAARELGEKQANISYHLRRLRDGGLLEISEEAEVRGGRAKRYRHRHHHGPRTRTHRISVDEELLIVAAVSAELRRRTARRHPDAQGQDRKSVV